MTPIATLDQAQVARWQWRSLSVGIAALMACALGAVLVSPTQFLRAYLAAYMFYLGVSLGSLAILMIYHVTGGGWGFLIRRILEAQIKTLPLLAVLYIPLAVGVSQLYLWAQPETVAANERLQEQQFYLNRPFFWGRATIYFAIWLGMAYFLCSWSRAEERTGDRRLTKRAEQWSGFGLVLYAVTLHFSAFDWIRSLESTFHSTILPMVVAVGQILSAQAFALLALVWFVARPPFARAVSHGALNDLGNLLLTFLVLWGYMVFFQLMLVWIGNLPTDVLWYVPRSQGGWQWVAWALFLLHFALPFFLLLMRAIKQNLKFMTYVAGLVFFMQLVYVYYQVMPAFPGTNVRQHWMDFLTPIGVGGIWFAYFLQRFRSCSLLPLHDINRDHALDVRKAAEIEAVPPGVLTHG